MTYNQETIIKQKHRNERDDGIHKQGYENSYHKGFICLRR